MTLYDDYVKYLKIDQKSPETIKGYNDNLKDFFKFKYGNKDLSNFTLDNFKNLTIQDIRDYKLSMIERNLAPNTMRLRFSAIVSAYTFLDDNGILTDNTMAYMIHTKILNKTKKEIVKKKEVLTDEESRIFLDYVQNSGNANADRDYLLYLVMITLALRVSEVIKIKHSDFLLDEKEIKIVGKGNKTVYMELDDYLIQVYKEYIEKHPSNNDILFLSRDGNQIAKRTVQDNIKRHVKEAGINKNISCHRIRATRLTSLFLAGADLISLQRVSRHESLNTLSIYISKDKQKIRNTMDLVTYK
jgi:integrase/recombinase XerD